MGMTKLIIVGAGYAGLLAANRAAPHVQVVLVNEVPVSVDRIRLHEVVAGTREEDRVLRSLADAVDPRVEVVIGRAVLVRPGEVVLHDGRRLTAEHVLVAVGSGAGAGSLAWARDHRDAVAALGAGASVQVRGAGFTGLETAVELAEARPDLRVTLVHDGRPFGHFPASAAAHVAAVLERHAITLTDLPTAADHVVDCTGFAYPTLARDSGLPVDPSGRLLTDETLAVPGHRGVWGCGDAVRVAGRAYLRGGCSTAEPMAGLAADQIRRVAAGQAPRPVDVGIALWCLSLGRRDGLIVRTTPEDRPTRVLLRGRPAAAVKELICRFAAYATVGLARWYVGVPGPKQPQPDPEVSRVA